MRSYNKFKAGCSGNRGRVFKIPPVCFPVPCGAMTVIGVSTLPQIMGDELFITMVKAVMLNSYQLGKK